jgi:hypothetical protein
MPNLPGKQSLEGSGFEISNCDSLTFCLSCYCELRDYFVVELNWFVGDSDRGSSEVGAFQPEGPRVPGSTKV